MPAPQIAALPEFFTLASGMVIRLTAVDPTSGVLVSGVTISGVSIDVDPVTVEAGPAIVPPILDPAFFAGEAA